MLLWHQNFKLDSIIPADPAEPYAIPFTTFSTSNGRTYSFFRDPAGGKPYVSELIHSDDPELDQTYIQYLDMLDRLFAGENTADIITDLLALANDPTFQLTANYYYHLGLAYELSGDEANAVTTYLTAWQDYCCDDYDWFPQPFTSANPYAIMARAKLILE